MSIYRSLPAVALALIFLLSPLSAAAQETYTIQPVNDSTEIKAFSSQGWLTMKGLPPKDHYLLKISYLRGFIDAIQFADVAPGQTTSLLDELQGLDLKQLADDIDKFYQEYPQYQSYSPAVVMLVILPRLKAGKPPIPEQNEATPAAEEKTDDSAAKPAESNGVVEKPINGD